MIVAGDVNKWSKRYRRVANLSPPYIRYTCPVYLGLLCVNLKCVG